MPIQVASNAVGGISFALKAKESQVVWYGESRPPERVPLDAEFVQVHALRCSANSLGRPGIDAYRFGSQDSVAEVD